MDRLVLVANSHRVAPGLLSWPAWQELRAAPVFCGDAAHTQLPFLAAAEVAVEILDPPDPRVFRDRARGGAAVWLASAGGDPEFVRGLGDLVAREGGVEMEVVYGSYDLPGARLLDLVATMDRLRSPGGCPWDAEQTHASLAPYMIEETYEAVETIETGDLLALREELGDVLLQVVFHSRVAEDRTDSTRWTIDDVAAGIVAKLVRRHPHVFGSVTVSGADEVVHNWDVIKAAEKDPASSALDHIPLGQPALSLALKLQRRALKAGLPPSLLPAPPSLPAAPSVADIGEALFALVAAARSAGVDPEAALRATARKFRSRFAAVEQAAGDPLPSWSEERWRGEWRKTPSDAPQG